jgi:hypothetical protein
MHGNMNVKLEWSRLPYLIEEGNGFCTDNGLCGSQDKYAHGFGLAFAAWALSWSQL